MGDDDSPEFNTSTYHADEDTTSGLVWDSPAFFVSSAARILRASSSLFTDDDPDNDGLWLALKLAILAIACMLSAIFSGLNLGLMCLDSDQLGVLVQAGERADATQDSQRHARWARRIQPLRKDGNLLLCTVLMGNVMVNACVAVVVLDFHDGVVAYAVATFVIFTIGEVLPQSVCYKHGLRIGALLVPLVRFFRLLMWPVLKPIAMILDCAFGEETGQVLDRDQLLAMVDYQRKRAPHLLSEQEANILRGSLDFSTKTAKHIMVPLSDCFCIDAQAVVNASLCSAVATVGFSRIPVVDRQEKRPVVVGTIHVKDLLLADMTHELSLKALLPVIGRGTFVVDDDRPLPELLDEFRQGAIQLAIVRSLVQNEDCDPYFKHVGILTLQDLLNTILQDDMAEVDVKRRNTNTSDTSAPRSMFSNVVRFSNTWEPASFDGRGELPRTVKNVRGLSVDELVAASAFLRRRHESLFGHVSHENLEEFLQRECRVSSGRDPVAKRHTSSDTALYSRGQPSEFAALVLSGEVKIFAGIEEFESTQGVWCLLGKRCLELAVESAGAAYVPDFTAFTAEEQNGVGGTRVLVIPAEAYRRLLVEKTGLPRVCL